MCNEITFDEPFIDSWFSHRAVLARFLEGFVSHNLLVRRQASYILLILDKPCESFSLGRLSLRNGWECAEFLVSRLVSHNFLLWCRIVLWLIQRLTLCKHIRGWPVGLGRKVVVLLVIIVSGLIIERLIQLVALDAERNLGRCELLLNVIPDLSSLSFDWWLLGPVHWFLLSLVLLWPKMWLRLFSLVVYIADISISCWHSVTSAIGLSDITVRFQRLSCLWTIEFHVCAFSFVNINTTLSVPANMQLKLVIKTFVHFTLPCASLGLKLLGQDRSEICVFLFCNLFVSLHKIFSWSFEVVHVRVWINHVFVVEP